MITPSFSLTATERVLPKLALDFTTANLDSRVTFTRITGVSNPATYVNSSGYVTAATDNQPRFDYDPITLACKGLLIEESRTNICIASEDFSNASWVKTNINTTGTPNYIDTGLSPANTQTADSVIPNTTNSTHSFQISLAITIGTAYTMSAFFKANGYNFVALQSNSTGNPYACFNISSGSVGTATATNPTITNYGNNWFRVSMTFTATAVAHSFRVYVCDADNSFSFAGDNSKNVLFWGAQLEAGAFATSYIPTTTTALTRNADVATMTGTNFSDWYNATEGAFQFQMMFNNITSGSSAFASTDGGTFANSMYFTRNFIGYGASTLDFNVKSGGVDQVAMYIASVATNTNTSYKECAAYKQNNYALSAIGAATKTDLSASVPTVNRLNLGFIVGGLSYLNGWLQKINYYPQRLTNNEVQAFSK